MAVNCNKLVDVSVESLEAKAALARSASESLAAALSDSYRGIELAHREVGKAAEVYFVSADEKLAAAMEALDQVQAIMRSAPAMEGAIAWTQRLDFVRLYREGVETGAIPAYDGQWSRFTSMMAAGQVLSISSILREDLAAVRERIREVISGVSNDTSRCNRLGVPYAVLSLQSALLDATVFAQIVAYVNTLEPLDPEWITEASKESNAVELTV